MLTEEQLKEMAGRSVTGGHQDLAEDVNALLNELEDVRAELAAAQGVVEAATQIDWRFEYARSNRSSYEPNIDEMLQLSDALRAYDLKVASDAAKGAK